MAWEEVEHNTFLPPEAKSVVLADLKDIWRRWKHEIKVKYFLPHIDDLEFLSQSPTERVEQDQWKELVTYWKDEDVQKIARKNAINVSKKQCLHRTGRTSFAILKQEMMMKGTDPSTLDVWLESRSRGKGFEDDDTLDLHTHFTRELSKKPELERDKDFKEQIFKNAMGEERYKRLSQVKTGKRTFENVIASMSCVQEIEELKMLKHGLIEEREKMKQIQDEFNHEKEKLRLEKEKVTSLGEKLELLISQLPTISSMLTIQTQVPGASSLRQETLSALKDVSSSKEQEVVGERSRKEKFIADYSKAFNIPKKIIAEGVVVGTIGQEGVPSGFVRVYVEKAHIPQEKLQRPSKGVTTIGEAVNQCVYWEFVNVESNARFVTWSDGSLQLLIENEAFCISEQDAQGIESYLFLMHEK
ncbi:UNVERIFIED_CONTAM: protein LEO1, partial [Sesamum radiatum]